MGETRILPVHLSPDELQERSNELAEKVQQRVSMDATRKNTAKQMKEEIDDMDDRIASLARVVRDKKEGRPVEVIQRHDVPRRLVLEIRTDTGEEVSSRPMSVAELQEHDQVKLQFAEPSEDLEAEAVEVVGRKGKKTVGS